MAGLLAAGYPARVRHFTGMQDPLIALLLGVLLGAAIGWLLGARRSAAAREAEMHPLAEELRQQLAARAMALTQAQSDGAEAQAALAAARATQQAVEKAAHEQRLETEQTLRETREARTIADAQLGTLRADLSREQTTHAAVAARLGELEKSLDQLRSDNRQAESRENALREQLLTAEKARSEQGARADSLAEKLARERAELQNIHEAFRKEFESVSNRLLVANANHFKEQSSEGLAKILDPLRENLKDFKVRLEETSSAAGQQNAVLKDQIARIGSEAANLARALKGDAKILGNWGEQRLEQILEKSGLQLGVHYERQHTAEDSETEQRRFLDVIVKLPDGKHLVIDSKVSLSSYEAHLNTDDDALRAGHLQRHIECLRRHVKDLAAKRYQDLYGISSPDFVLMYIPLEAAFFTAVAHAPELFSEALDRNIVLITNSTLLATLRTVTSVWRLAAQQENAAEIARRGGALYDKFCGFIGDLEKVGAALGEGQKQYDDAMRKLSQGKGNLVRQTEELRRLGAKASKTLPAALRESAHEGEETPALPSPIAPL